MVKVITYGTYDLLHRGHIRLLERAKALGDRLIVGVTSDDFDRRRGKINNQQSLMERIKAVEATGLADEILIEEYEGQKIDDIRRLGADIFTVGSDWEGQLDYLEEYCRVVYLPRTEGVSSSEVRAENRHLRIGLIGHSGLTGKFIREVGMVNGVEAVGVCAPGLARGEDPDGLMYTDRPEELLQQVDAVYVISRPEKHYGQVKQALEAGKHVLCESPVATERAQCRELFALAKERRLILMDAIKTAYAMAFERLVLLTKTGMIGDVVSVDAVCTSLSDGIFLSGADLSRKWNGICAWGPTAMLPVFQILGTDYVSRSTVSRFVDEAANMDAFTKVDFVYPSAAASIRVAKGAKAEGELVITGTKGYIYVPAPWWLTDYFEVRFENQAENRRFFYQLDGEGIRYEIVALAKSVEQGHNISRVTENISEAICGVVEDFNFRRDMTVLGKGETPWRK